MTYEQLKALAPVEFKRFTGVQRPTFDKMVEALGEQERDKKKRGRSPKLAVADQGLIALPYGGKIASILLLRGRGSSPKRQFELIFAWVRAAQLGLQGTRKTFSSRSSLQGSALTTCVLSQSQKWQSRLRLP